MQIWFDMDGTIVDYDKFADSVIKNRGSGKFFHELTDTEKENRQKFWNYIIEKEEDFWLRLDFMKGMKEAVNYLKTNYKSHNFGIISHAPNFTSNENYCKKVEKYKKEWIKKYLPDIFTNIKVIKPKQEKYEFMIGNPKDNILIDDVEHNIINWKQKGGVGIIYKNHKQMLKEIKEILKNNE